jgi:FHS family L-fucose permease-like MFS transporter
MAEHSWAEKDASAFRLCHVLFFAMGVVAVLHEPLVYRLREMFSLSFTDAMLTQSAFFIAYLFFAIPAGSVVARFGYVRSIAFGLTVMAAGCLLFARAAAMGTYGGFLVALFTVATGIVLLQVTASPFVAVLRLRRSVSSRLSLTQAFNSLGRVIGPLIAAVFFLQGSNAVLEEAVEAVNVRASAALMPGKPLPSEPFVVIAVILLLLAAVFWVRRRPQSLQIVGVSKLLSWKLLRQPRLMLGVLSIFLYVGAEVSIGSGLTNYLMQRSVLASQAGAFGAAISGMLDNTSLRNVELAAPQIAGAMVSIYWGLAMVGRFIGSAVLARVPAGRVLFAHAIAAAGLAVVASQTSGAVAVIAVLSIGLANSIMFPAIFALALEGLGEEIPRASALLCLAIVGGAVIPLLYGAVADRYGLSLALLVPALCYIAIAGYGRLASVSSDHTQGA